MENEKKLKYQVWWDEKEGIIRNKSWGDFEEKDAKKQMQAIYKIIESKSGIIKVLNDLQEAGKASSGARKIFVNMLKSPKIEK